VCVCARACVCACAALSPIWCLDTAPCAGWPPTFSPDDVKEIQFRQRVVLRTVDDGKSPPTKQQDPKKNIQLLKRFMKFYVCKVKLASHVITTISYYLSSMPPIRYFKHKYSKTKWISTVVENKKLQTSNMCLSSKTGPLHNLSVGKE